MTHSIFTRTTMLHRQLVLHVDYTYHMQPVHYDTLILVMLDDKENRFDFNFIHRMTHKWHSLGLRPLPGALSNQAKPLYNQCAWNYNNRLNFLYVNIDLISPDAVVICLSIINKKNVNMYRLYIDLTPVCTYRLIV